MIFRALCSCSLAIGIVGCGNDTPAESPTSVEGAEVSSAASDATITFSGKPYELHVVGDCGAAADGTYNTWAFTLDADGKPVGDQPQMHAMSEANWSIIDFSDGRSDDIIRVYREGNNKIRFNDGVLEFDGELGAGLKERATVRIVCP